MPVGTRRTTAPVTSPSWGSYGGWLWQLGITPCKPFSPGCTVSFPKGPLCQGELNFILFTNTLHQGFHQTSRNSSLPSCRLTTSTVSTWASCSHKFWGGTTCTCSSSAWLSPRLQLWEEGLRCSTCARAGALARRQRARLLGCFVRKE